jgi:acetyltransferase
VNDTPAALPPAYPAELEHIWQPAGGPPLTIRALRPDDLDRELRFIHGLSEQTLYQRLQYVSREVTATAAARLLEMDYLDNLALGALVGGDGVDGGEIVGVSRYARIAGTDSAECAIVVGDGWQGRGLGTELMRSLAVAASARGIRTLEGVSLAENQRIGDWARRFGFRARTEPNSGVMLRVIVDLSELPS